MKISINRALLRSQPFLNVFGRSRSILTFMRSRGSRIIATVILVTCLVCPLVEIFDNWDHTMQTGNDTEYALVVLALCIGVAYSFARFILTLPLFRHARDFVSKACSLKFLPCTLQGSFFVSPIPLSPPALALRI